MQIEALFQSFLETSVARDKDLEYCLLQSTVEPTIRFKFGAWLNERFQREPDRLTINLMETQRIDLTVGIDDEIYIIEFGHLLNLLKHDASGNRSKIESDSKKIRSKAESLFKKMRNHTNPDFENDKKIFHLTCSLFSDFKLKPVGLKYRTTIEAEKLKSGTLFKYGNEFAGHDYFREYSQCVNQPNESRYLFGYTEFAVIPGQLSLHYKFIPCNI